MRVAPPLNQNLTSLKELTGVESCLEYLVGSSASRCSAHERNSGGAVLSAF